MIKFAIIVLGTSLLWQSSSDLPSGHPPVGEMPALPQGHPPMIPPGHPEVLPSGHPPVPGADRALDDANAQRPAARPEDVESVDAILAAYYETMSGPRGELRNWDRFRSLLLPQAHFVTGRVVDDLAMPLTFTVDEFITMNRTYFERGGYFEDEIHRHVDTFGNIAQAFSTYESRRGREETLPYSRGINSIQLIFDGSRWWIANVMWDYERLDGPTPNLIPEEFQPAGQ